MRAMFIFCGMLLMALSCFAQPAPDTSFLTLSKHHIVSLYQDAIGGQSRLYNGSKYEAPEHSYEQHPYFLSIDWITGSLYYDGERFDEVPLMYDLLNNALVTEHYPSGHAIQLVDAKLERFSIDRHTFEKIDNESVANSLPASGFYDILHAGETKLVARRQKFMREEIVSNRIETNYEPRNRYFILRNGVFFPVKSKGSALKLMADKKQELKRFLKEKKLPFSKNRELLLKGMAEHYDTLR
jgi:hypothetical protein